MYQFNVLLAATTCLLALALSPAHATLFRCGPGNVRCLIAAIHAANANGQQNTIRLQAGSYTLTTVDNMTSAENANGLPVITSPLTIRGAGAAATRLERDASAQAFRFLEIRPAGFLTLQGLTLRGGRLDSGSGGGIRNDGTLTLRNSVITDTSASDTGGGGGDGGAIFNSGTLTLTQSRITDTHAVEAGGILNNGGRVTITKSTLAHLNGQYAAGALFNAAGTVVITATTFAQNGSLDAGAIWNQGTMLITDSTFTENSTAFGPGAVANSGILKVTNTTFARNVGAITNAHTLLLTNSTLASGSFLASVSGATTIVQNTLFASNVGSSQGLPDCGGVVTSLGNNLISDPTGCTITLQPSDLTGDPGVGEYIDNGTPGHGHLPLLSTSPAIDAGDNAACPWRDQRRQPRVDIPGVGTSRCDIGAIEFQGEEEADGDDVATPDADSSPTLADLARLAE